jgi:UDP-N-acetylglucosamine--N-acetylmuramyl-(pentapeptide) pyrophosphoryl-undecaprenol N-acetylglucosamine transferase
LARSLYPRLASMEGLSVVHITGTRDYSSVVSGLTTGFPSIEILPYTEQMDQIFYRTDLALCRAGALTISELVEFEIPAIYVPYRHAVGNHQYENARLLRDHGASEILEERELEPERLLAELARMSRPDELAKYRSRLKGFRRPRATERVLRALESLVPESRTTDG